MKEVEARRIRKTVTSWLIDFMFYCLYFWKREKKKERKREKTQRKRELFLFWEKKRKGIFLVYKKRERNFEVQQGKKKLKDFVTRDFFFLRVTKISGFY